MTLIYAEKLIKNASTNETVSKIISTSVIRGLGGFGNKGKMKIVYPKVPERKPDCIV